MAACCAAFALLQAAPAAAQIQAVSIAQNLAFALHVTAPPGDTSRLFIVGQKGDIRILKNGSLLPTPFLDISALVHQTAGEQGLLGMVFHPDYATNGHFYVNYTGGAGFGNSVVRRYTVSAHADSADPASGQTVLQVAQLQTNHNGGHLVFGPDGYLWIAFGDGGNQSQVQDPMKLIGKMLRVDVDGDDFPADSLRNYAIPPDNPFVGDPGTLDEIWALGLRNPWRYNFDRLTGDLWIGDVGQNAFEEVNFEAAPLTGGQNYGWPKMEGTSCFNPPVDCDTAGVLTLPIYEYAHGLTTFHAVVAGYVYRGSVLPTSLVGHFFFADESWQKVWSFRYENGMVTELTDWSTVLNVGGGGPTLQFPASFWQDDAGELYIVEYRQQAAGEIWKIVPDPAFVGVPEPAARGAGLQLGAPWPNPADGATRFEVLGTAGARIDVTVHDAAGRLVRRLHSGTSTGRPSLVTWDGRSSAGAAVPAGVYFLRATSGEESAAQRVTRIR
jgi:glucose/arabinose dehydrogenase